MKTTHQHIPENSLKGSHARTIKHDDQAPPFERKMRGLRKTLSKLGYKSLNDVPTNERWSIMEKLGFKRSQYKAKV